MQQEEPLEAEPVCLVCNNKRSWRCEGANYFLDVRFPQMYAAFGTDSTEMAAGATDAQFVDRYMHESKCEPMVM